MNHAKLILCCGYENHRFLAFSLDAPGWITSTLFNMNGVQVRTLIDGYQPSGTHRLVIDGENIPNGIYICRLMADGKVCMKKLVRIGTP
jgi:hypothetical protein